MAVGGWVCLLAPLVGFLAILLAGRHITRRQAGLISTLSVFVGLMLSIGSSGIVNQAVSGLMLMYTRAMRPGEFVKIGETEGTVKSAVHRLRRRCRALLREAVARTVVNPDEVDAELRHLMGVIGS